MELIGKDAVADTNGSENGPLNRTRRQLEQSWSIGEHLKNDNADGLFTWIGECIAKVVQEGCKSFSLPINEPLPMGVTFSFPMEQMSLSEAKVMGMGKGFAVSANTDLGSRLLTGYNNAKKDTLPSIRIAAIANDSVSTLVSFIFKFDESVRRRASMGLILGTGCNATIPLKMSQLHPSKRPATVSVLPGESAEDVKIAINTEWSINGTAPPLRKLGLITRWDEVLASQNETPGFQPLEYMTAGRYLGELGRLMLLDYMTNILNIREDDIPKRLLERHGMTTSFLSHYKPYTGESDLESLRSKLVSEFPESSGGNSFTWTNELVEVLYFMGKAIEVRAAHIVAAAILGLLTLGGELPQDSSEPSPEVRELGIGYTGGCIVHFQDYLVDCQTYIDELMDKRFGKGKSPVRVVLSPCHDGGITGAGILVAAASSSENAET